MPFDRSRYPSDWGDRGRAATRGGGVAMGYEAMVEDAHDVDGWHGCPSPRCGHCGSVLRMALVPVVRWICPDCVRWAWVEPPESALVWQTEMALEGAS